MGRIKPEFKEEAGLYPAQPFEVSGVYPPQKVFFSKEHP